MAAMSDLRARQYGRYGRLIGFSAGRAVISVPGVDPPSIAGGATGFVDVTVAGAKVGALRRQRVAMFPPTALETGLVITSTPIQANNTVRINLLNTTGAPIDGASRTWTARLFSMF